MFFELYDSNKQNIHAKFINRCFQNKQVESPSIRRCTIVIMIYFHINALPICLFWIQGQIFELNDTIFFLFTSMFQRLKLSHPNYVPLPLAEASKPRLLYKGR